MKIKVRTTDNCVVFDFAVGFEFWMLKEEFLAFETKKLIDDGGRIMRLYADEAVLIQSPARISEDCGEVKFIRIRMDVTKFMNTVNYLIEKGLIRNDKFHEMDTDSFAWKVSAHASLTFVQILKHRMFTAKEKLYDAVRKVPTEHLARLRDDISRLIGQGKVIAPDWAECSFYFYPEDGKGYNGGIIWHGSESGYSIHT